MQRNISNAIHVQDSQLQHNSRHKDIPELTVRQKEQFWSKVQMGAVDVCWPWIGAVTKNRWGGGIYGIWRVGELHLRPHRVAYTILIGKIPEGLTLDHTCLNGLCCNPSHTEPVPGSVNSKRYWDANPVMVCKNGHPREKGKRCKGCRKLNLQLYKQRHPDKWRAISRNQKRKERARKQELVLSTPPRPSPAGFGEGLS